MLLHEIHDFLLKLLDTVGGGYTRFVYFFTFLFMKKSLSRYLLNIVPLLLIGGAIAYAAAPSGGYLPGATNDPACAPGDTDCFVQASVLISDHAASNYIDIGGVRQQWGTSGAADANGLVTITFPQAFANTNYGFTATPIQLGGNADITQLEVKIVAKTTSSVTVRMDWSAGVPAETSTASWTAVGQK